MKKDDKRKYTPDISSIVDNINADTETHMEGIDWEKSVTDITRMVKINKFKKHSSTQYFNFSFRFAIPVIASIFIIGISLGYFLSNWNNKEVPSYLPEKAANFTLLRLESTLNRREINVYFEQAHLLMTEIMEDCEKHPINVDIKYLNNRRVKDLLKKNRYFNKDSSDQRWLVSQKLLKKIEWLLLELLMSDGQLDCKKQKILQRYISEERLLFKLRLLSSEASFSEV